MNEVENTEQTAVAEEPKVEPNEAGTTAESGAAQVDDGLDELLKEFDTRREAQEAPKEPAKPEPSATQQIDVTQLAVLEQRLNEQEAREQRRELNALCTRLIEGTEADAIDAEAFLIAAAKRNPDLERAYIQRASRPGTWNKIEAELRKDVARRFGKKVDKQVTASRDAVASAVRSASTAAPPAEVTDESVKNMTKEEFDDASRKLGITPV